MPHDKASFLPENVMDFSLYAPNNHQDYLKNVLPSLLSALHNNRKHLAFQKEPPPLFQQQTSITTYFGFFALLLPRNMTCSLYSNDVPYVSLLFYNHLQ